jgi:hypothetical protein
MAATEMDSSGVISESGVNIGMSAMVLDPRVNDPAVAQRLRRTGHRSALGGRERAIGFIKPLLRRPMNLRQLLQPGVGRLSAGHFLADLRGREALTAGE